MKKIRQLPSTNVWLEIEVDALVPYCPFTNDHTHFPSRVQLSKVLKWGKSFELFYQQTTDRPYCLPRLKLRQKRMFARS
jgi:hypothetical protein